MLNASSDFYQKYFFLFNVLIYKLAFELPKEFAGAVTKTTTVHRNKNETEKLQMHSKSKQIRSRRFLFIVDDN